jgi:hypothetical protein
MWEALGTVAGVVFTVAYFAALNFISSRAEHEPAFAGRAVMNLGAVLFVAIAVVVYRWV